MDVSPFGVLVTLSPFPKRQSSRSVSHPNDCASANHSHFYTVKDAKKVSSGVNLATALPNRPFLQSCILIPLRLGSREVPGCEGRRPNPLAALSAAVTGLDGCELGSPYLAPSAI
jgi:hypothetical protein